MARVLREEAEVDMLLKLLHDRSRLVLTGARRLPAARSLLREGTVHDLLYTVDPRLDTLSGKVVVYLFVRWACSWRSTPFPVDRRPSGLYRDRRCDEAEAQREDEMPGHASRVPVP